MKRAAVLVLLAAAGAASAATTVAFVGPMRLATPGFGWVVEGTGGSEQLRIYDHGRWRVTTPPLGRRFIEDVAFSGERNGWVAEYDCASAHVFLFRTANGGRSWRALGVKGSRSCGGGPTYLSFVDATHGWMLPASPNGDVGALLRTTNGGKTFATVARCCGGGQLRCLGPIAFDSRTLGWQAQCGAVYRTSDGGRTWRLALRGRHDLPHGGVAAGVAPAAITFDSVNGRTLARRKVATCTDTWPESVVDARTWWVVDGQKVSVTTNAGGRWRTVAAKGLPSGACVVMQLSAASARSAWAVVRVNSSSRTMLYATRDAGRSWHAA